MSSPGSGSTCDVLVVGAGPTGLMLANWLVRLGVRVTVVDGKSGPTVQSRALVVQARTMEIYDQLGLADEVLAAGWSAEAVSPGYESRIFGRIPIGALGGDTTPYPRIQVLQQSRNEEILYANLRTLGGEVRWGHELTALDEPAGGGVRATMHGPDGESAVDARFCVGADGSSSAVRRLRGVAFEGVTNPHTFYVIDATRTAGLVDRAVNVRLGRRDFLIAFPMGPRGDWRLIGLARHPQGAAGGPADIGENDARARLRGVFAVTYGSSRWYATYRVHHRVAAAFRDGPVFLAGDAAHVHSPVGAQGMNTGLQDAHNLAFKLADVVHGRAGDRWLDRYEAERRPVALRLVGSTDRLFGLITSQRLPLRAMVRLVAPLLGPVAVRALPKTSQAPRYFQYISQTRIHYWMEPGAKYTAHGRRGRVVGRRLPWAGGNYAALRSLRWQIHGYGGVVPGVAQVLAAGLGLPVYLFGPAPGTGLREGRLYLVRPDGFVAAEAIPADAPEVFKRALPR